MSKRGLALVTGAGTGIGRAVAIALGRHGYEVIATGRRTELLDRTVREIRQAGGRADAYSLDVTDASAVEDLIFNASAISSLEVVVANAGTFTSAPISEAELDAWDRQIDVNLSGVFFCVRAAIRRMRAQPEREGSRGHIFTMNSGAGVRGYAAGVAYASAKHGVRGLVESARPVAAAYDIKITDIVISATVESEMSIGRDVVALPAETVAHTVISCLQLTGFANWDRVDIGQIRR